MNTSRRRAAGMWVVILLLFLIVIGLAIDVTLTVRLSASVDGLQAHTTRGLALPCAAIPTRLVLEDPACAQKLVDAMNVTNVRFGPVP